jgi:photosystem II stability/assembly factor-like uncharacterized protein
MIGAVLTLFLATPPSASAQRPAPRPAGSSAQWKGIWEPVSYGQDVRLESVFFVTPDIGWVSGAAGTILVTRDGGTHWEAQLGGDPAAADGKIYSLRFVDGTHGWATQHTGMAAKLLRTTDGERWSQVGTVPEHFTDLQFTSHRTGFYAAGQGLSRTDDAGKTWQLAGSCKAHVSEGGLARDVSCDLQSMTFATPSVGYAVGYGPVRNSFFLMKTGDGGSTWSTTVVGETGNADGIFFVDEQSGWVHTKEDHVFETHDGGETWQGVVATGGERFRFADTEVGWAFRYSTLSYTTDGGKRWQSRAIPFPATPWELSLPRRDRAYVVGDHGMIFRYRVVPASLQVAGAIEAPAMPGFDMALDGQMTTLESQLAAVEKQAQAEATKRGESLGVADSSASAATTAGALPADSATAPSFTDACCAQAVTQAEATVGSMAAEMPGFFKRYRSPNLFATAIQLMIVLPDRISSLRQAFRSLRSARDVRTVAFSLAAIDSAVKAARREVRQALLLDPPLLASTGGGGLIPPAGFSARSGASAAPVAAVANSTSPASAVTTGAPSPTVDATAADAAKNDSTLRRETKDAAKKLKGPVSGLFKKRP